MQKHSGTGMGMGMRAGMGMDIGIHMTAGMQCDGTKKAGEASSANTHHVFDGVWRDGASAIDKCMLLQMEIAYVPAPESVRDGNVTESAASALSMGCVSGRN